MLSKVNENGRGGGFTVLIKDIITMMHGYNGDMLDRTGLIYLRARYYDPSVSRFSQIDNNYDGEKQSVSSQNRYVYSLNNPYKYVDRNGNSSLAKTVSDAMKKALRNAGNAITNASKKAKSAMDTWVTKAMEITKNALKIGANAVVGASSNNKSGNGGGTSKAKPKVKKVIAEAKCPEKEKVTNLNKIIDCREIANSAERAFLPRGYVDVEVRSTGKFFAGGSGSIKINEQPADLDLTKIYKQNTKTEEIKKITSVVASVIGIVDPTQLSTFIGEISDDYPSEPTYGIYEIKLASYLAQKMVIYNGLPFVFHQTEEIYAGIMKYGDKLKGTKDEILLSTTNGPKVNFRSGISDYSDEGLIKFGSSYYLKAQGPYTNFTFHRGSFTNKKKYTALL